MTSLPRRWALSAAHSPTTNQDSNFASELGTTRKITLMYLTVLRGYLRHILSALKLPWQASRNIFQVSTLAPSTVSHAHHSPLRHGGSSLLTWFLSLFLAPAADLLSPQLDQIQETVLRAGSLDGVKSLSLLLSATKVGRWQVGEKTLQADFPSGDASCQMGWEGLPDTGMGQEGFAELHIHAFGSLGTTARHAEARTILPHFFFLSSSGTQQRQGEMMICRKFPYQFFTAVCKQLKENTSFEVRQTRRFWHCEILFSMPVWNITSLKGLEISFCHVKQARSVSKFNLMICHWLPKNLTKRSCNSKHTLLL